MLIGHESLQCSGSLVCSRYLLRLRRHALTSKHTPTPRAGCAARLASNPNFRPVRDFRPGCSILAWMRRSSALKILSWLLPLAAAGGDWPTFGHDPQRTGWAVTEKSL